LASAPAGGALGGQALFLGLGAEKSPVLELSQNTGMLY
jgi:hypothetical protein